MQDQEGQRWGMTPVAPEADLLAAVTQNLHHLVTPILSQNWKLKIAKTLNAQRMECLLSIFNLWGENEFDQEIPMFLSGDTVTSQN